MSTPRRSRTRRPGTVTLVKDLLSYLGGWALIVHQAVFVPPADFNLTLVLLGGTLVGIPGVGQLLALRTGSGPLPDPPEESPSPSPLPSPSGPGANR
ncbi:hypothetical protein [Actinoplanes palleronii]|uniref:Uncharacterized protein n=1 Tax=Actinoplanes palleronii TaxID=113570 RepID=A0ABQ4B420_9ACTN|nr:hypothetical protein [Actinoplanes palleronii]GIE65413.1 hypothetical protein Apa02nite_015210 [Actinoplanes palleronii]